MQSSSACCHEGVELALSAAQLCGLKLGAEHAVQEALRCWSPPSQPLSAACLALEEAGIPHLPQTAWQHLQQLAGLQDMRDLRIDHLDDEIQAQLHSLGPGLALLLPAWSASLTRLTLSHDLVFRHWDGVAGSLTLDTFQEITATPSLPGHALFLHQQEDVAAQAVACMYSWLPSLTRLQHLELQTALMVADLLPPSLTSLVLRGTLAVVWGAGAAWLSPFTPNAAAGAAAAASVVDDGLLPGTGAHSPAAGPAARQLPALASVTLASLAFMSDAGVQHLLQQQEVDVLEWERRSGAPVAAAASTQQVELEAAPRAAPSCCPSSSKLPGLRAPVQPHLRAEQPGRAGAAQPLRGVQDGQPGGQQPGGMGHAEPRSAAPPPPFPVWGRNSRGQSPVAALLPLMAGSCTQLSVSYLVSRGPHDPAGYDCPALLQLRELTHLRLFAAGDQRAGCRMDCAQLAPLSALPGLDSLAFVDPQGPEDGLPHSLARGLLNLTALSSLTRLTELDTGNAWLPHENCRMLLHSMGKQQRDGALQWLQDSHMALPSGRRDSGPLTG